MFRLNPFIGLLLLASLGYGQSPLDFFPHHVGDAWRYEIFDYFFAHVGTDWERVTGDSTAADGSIYVFINGQNEPTYRIDTLNQVWRKPIYNPSCPDSFYLLFKLDATPSDTWQSPAPEGDVPVCEFCWTQLTLTDTVSVFGQSRVRKIFACGDTFSGEEWELAAGIGIYTHSVIFNTGQPDALHFLLTGAIINGDTLGNVTGLDEPETSSAPLRIQLHPAYPNPFNPSTRIAMTLPRAMQVSVRVYNILGQQVAVLWQGRLPAGRHQVTFEAGHLPAGVYTIVLRTPQSVQTRKVVLVR